jgi:membrane protease YdiL (CAAX protease family)
MTGRLKQYPPSLQLVTLVGLYMIFIILYAVFLEFVFPAISGYTLKALQDELSADQLSHPLAPKVLGYLKLTQFLFTLVVYLLPPIILAYLVDDKPFKWLRLHRRPRFLPVILSFLIMLVALPFVAYTGDWNHTWPFSDEIRRLEEQAIVLTRALLTMNSFSDLIVDLILIAAIPAIAEEFFFRGVVQRLLIRSLPKLPWLAVFITAISFSAIHLQWADFVPRVILGFLLGAIYYLSGNLWLSILGHFLNNGLQVTLVYLYQVKLIKTDPMSEEPTEWYLAAISLALTIGAIWLFDRQTLACDDDPDHRDNFADNIDSIGK